LFAGVYDPRRFGDFALGVEKPIASLAVGELIDTRVLRQTLKEVAAASAPPPDRRQAALIAIKGAYAQGRARVRQAVQEEGLPGLAAARALSALQDAVIGIIHEFALGHVGKDAGVSVIATGGYGRGELAPGSDIDLLFLRPARTASGNEGIIEFILYMLWDLGLKVGHATRSVAEGLRLARTDVTIRTAMLEARHLCGDRALFEEMRRKFWEDAAANGRDFVEAKLAERKARHSRQGESRYLVEPNIKESKGGLRDLQTLYWIGKYLYRVEDAAALVEHNVFSKEEFRTFQKAEAFLWNVRVKLHYLLERAEERLTFDVQPAMAAAMGYTDAEKPRRAVEAFMRAYFLVAKDVGDLTRIFIAALEEQHRKPRPSLRRILPGFLKQRSPDDDFYVENGRLCANPAIFKADPANLIRLFHVADSKQVDIHPNTLRTVTRSLDLITDKVRQDPAANRAFLETLCSRNDPERALRLMNEAGVFGRFIPEFGHAVGLMQFNMYHHYTVDEHLIRAIGNIATIERGELADEHPLTSDVIKRIKSREALYCAVLLHDMAKGLPGDHSDVGAVIAESLCPRLGLSESDTRAVAWLVKNHLVMSDTAQRRDVSDPKTVRDFVALVQTPELLRLLLILTVCDIRAVGPGVWNGWKGQLLRELYYAAESMMTGGDQVPARIARVAEAKAMLAARLADFTPEQRERALNRHYDNYWLAFEADEQERHARLMAKADASGELLTLGAESNSFRAVTEIMLYTPDHAGLFSQLAGAIAMSGGSIVDAKAFTTTDGFAFDVFSVQDAEGEAFNDKERLTRLRQTIEKTLRGQVWPRRALQGKQQKTKASAFRITPQVLFDNDASQIATVVEVECLDRPGLLYDVTQAIFESGLSISTSMVATYGEKAVDVFYVRDGFGHKITHPTRLEAVKARLTAALAPEARPAA
jgi:[protein-PII] uridylyltransferase